MGGMTPSDVTAGQLSTTDLSPYMSPFLKGVIDPAMQELNTQQGIAQQGIDDQAQSQGAFGGDRQYLQKGVLGNKFNQLKSQFLGDLYQKNFLNAQQMAGNDITNRLNADTGNQDRRATLFQQGGQGLGALANLYGQAGTDLTKYGVNELGSLSNMGFGFGNTLQQNQLASGALQQQQNQAILNAQMQQFLSQTQYPQQQLQNYLGAIQNPAGYGQTTTKTNPGIAGYLNAGGNLLQGIGSVIPGTPG